jgi:hypothetical protein
VVSTGPEEHRVLTATDVLDGGNVLPGFTLGVAELFAAVELGETNRVQERLSERREALISTCSR